MSASECLRQSTAQSFQIKNELEDTFHNGTDTTPYEFKYDISENNTTNASTTSTNNSMSTITTTSNVQPKSNVLVMTKPNSLLGAQPTTSKKFKTIVNTKNNSNILNNNGNYF